MSDQNVLTARGRKIVTESSSGTPLIYWEVITDDGVWKHAEGSDYIFSFVPNSWTDAEKKVGYEAFKAALEVPNKIKEAVKATSGTVVEEGVYIDDPDVMVKALNSIDGMAQTGDTSGEQQGDDYVADITTGFFQVILDGLGGDVTAMETYLTTQMGDFQMQLDKEHDFHHFGSVIGMVSVDTDFDVAVTTFKYVYSDLSTAAWVEQLSCSSQSKFSYDYKYEVIDFLYEPN
ncbi:hypothetical protein [Burkholderia sp. BCC0322]|uniref:hypothetical protein n=1 Tax=unclassified Burkholderia TaxID=2613784 RepID=UPI00158870C5|nr:hypothetical protein [Burkholderia sp. BCC0322]